MADALTPIMSPVRPSPLHHARIEAVRRALIRLGARRIADLGCGRGPLLLSLLEEGRIDRAVAVDCDSTALRSLSELLPNGAASVTLRQGCFMDRRLPTEPVDAAILIETIEHIEPSRLSAVEFALFQSWRPRHVLLTTPNADYNPILGAPSHRRRHWDHRFEWGRTRFAAWAENCGARHGYTFAIEAVGPTAPGVGGSTQMAVFTRDHEKDRVNCQET